jgi:Xaa-Pro aminopeptidase
MERNDLGAFVFWRPDELVMLLGYMPHWGLSFLVVTAADAVLHVPAMEPDDILPSGIRTERYPWGDISCPDPWERLYGSIGAQLARQRADGKSLSFIRHIGGSAPCRMSGEGPLLPADLPERLGRLAAGGYKDVLPQLLALYDYKTHADSDALRVTHTVAKRAVERFYELVQPGITERELASAIEAAVQNMTGCEGIGFAKAWPMVQSGPLAAAAGRYNRTTNRRLCAAELVVLEMGVCVDGYWADITRTAVAGPATSRQNELHRVVEEALQEALALLTPGATMSDVDKAAREHIAKAGYGQLFNHALGHQTGFRYHDPGAVLSPASTGILEEGMVLTVEPGIYGEQIGGGIRIEENVLITAGGYELLSNFSRSLTGK